MLLRVESIEIVRLFLNRARLIAVGGSGIAFSSNSVFHIMENLVFPGRSGGRIFILVLALCVASRYLFFSVCLSLLLK